MTEPTIPDYANLLRRAAANHAADASRYASQEQKLTTELARFEEWMAGEHARIQAELDEAQAKADEQLRAISADWETRKRDLAETGRAKTEHQKHATGAERSWRNWCHDEGIDPADLPPLRDTGPMPAIPAVEPRPETVDLARHVGQDVVLRTFGGTKIAGRLIGAGERVQVRQDDGTDCYVAAGDVVEVMRVAEIAPPLGFDPNSTGLVVAQVPDMTIPDTGLAPALLVPAAGNGHRKPGPLQRLTRRTGGQAASDAAESPADEQNEAAS